MMKRLRITVCALLVLMLLSGCAASQSSMKASRRRKAYNYAYEYGCRRGAGLRTRNRDDHGSSLKAPPVALMQARPTQTTAITR